MKIKKLSIIVPVFNEAATLPDVYKKIQRLKLSLRTEVIFVDDGSTDGSTGFLKRMHLGRPKNTVFIFHAENQGKGAAIRSAMPHVTGSHVIIQDADKEYHPRDIRVLVEAASKSTYGVVFGSRNRDIKNNYLYPMFYQGAKILSAMINLLFNQTLTDPLTCYKLFPTNLLKSVRLSEDGFGTDIEMTSRIAARGIPILEVSVSYEPRTYAEGKKIHASDGIRSIFIILKCWIQSKSTDTPHTDHYHSLEEQAIALHKDVPPDWYESSVKTNILQKFWHGAREKHIRKHASPVNGAVLDIGSADGYFSNIIVQETRAKRLVGVDVLPASVAYAKRRYRSNRKMSFLTADAHNLPFKANSFDATFSIESLEHVLDPVKALAEMKRVTNTNGYAMVLIPTENLLFKIIWFFWTKSKGRVWKDSHVHTFEPSALPDMLRKTGFSNVESHYFLLGMLLLVKGYKRPVRTR